MPERNSDLGTKEQVFGLAFGDQIRTYPLSLFENQALIHDTLADRNVVIFAVASGVGVRAYGRDGHTFTRSQSSTNQETIFTDETGVDWQTQDNALVSLDGSAGLWDSFPSATHIGSIGTLFTPTPTSTPLNHSGG